MVALTGSTEVKVMEGPRSAAVAEKHSCDNISGVDLLAIHPAQP